MAIKICFKGGQKLTFRESRLAGLEIPHNLEVGETGKGQTAQRRSHGGIEDARGHH